MPIQFNVRTITLLLLTGAFVASVAYFWWIHRRSLTDMGSGRKRLALGLRLALVALLFLALAGARWVVRSDTLSVIFLLDSSRSVRDDQKETALRFIREAVKTKRRGDTVGLITFGRDADIQVLPGDRLDVGVAADNVRHTGPTDATDIAQAVDTALSLIPHGSAGKVVVLSDGNENIDSALAKAPDVTARGFKLDSLLLLSGLKKEALIEKTIVPSHVKIGEPFHVDVIVNALNPQRGRLTLRRDGQPVGPARDIHIEAGRRVHTFQVTLDKAGLYRLEASLETDPSQDTLPENNRGLAFVAVRGRPQVLYVAPTPDRMEFLRKALAAQNIDVAYAPPSALPTTAAAFQRFDSVLLSDTPRDFFSQAQLNALQISTRDFGVGFGMIGGEDSFGLGGYRNTVVEEMLPVSMDIRKMQRFPPVCVALVIDRSGSMEEGGNGVIGSRKIDLAIQAAIRAVQGLKPTDKVAVVSFTETADLQVPLTSVEHSSQIIAGLQRIGPGGGTSIYSGAKLAFDTIKNDGTPIKHIILLTDGQSNDPDWRPLLAEMRRRKITMSTVGVGADSGDINTGLLGALAQTTGGRFYPVIHPQDIPRIYMQEIERISSRPIIEEPFTPRATQGAETQMPGLVLNALPPLLGYNATEIKPTADLLLLSHHNDPIYATWRYGLGRTFAFTSDDKNKWAVQWLSWSDYGKFWAEAIRGTLRSLAPSDFQTQVTMEGTRGHIVVDALDRNGRFIDRLNFRAKIAGPDTDGSLPAPDLPLRQSGPGHYEAWFDAAQIGSYLVNVLRDLPNRTVESTVTGLVIPYSPEYKDLTANSFLMTRLAQAGGGTALVDPAQVFGGERPIAETPFELYDRLVLLAMLLFPFDVAVRRLTLQRDDFQRVGAWLRARRGRALRGLERDLRKAGLESAHVVTAQESVRTAEPRSQGVEEVQQEGSSPVGRANEGVREETASGLASSPDAIPSEPAEELSGMGRLMAAKRRARDQQKPKG